jgi:hypothetical protein
MQLLDSSMAASQPELASLQREAICDLRCTVPESTQFPTFSAAAAIRAACIRIRVFFPDDESVSQSSANAVITPMAATPKSPPL